MDDPFDRGVGLVGVDGDGGRGVLGMGVGVGFRVWGRPFMEPRRRRDFRVGVLVGGGGEEEFERGEEGFGG